MGQRALFDFSSKQQLTSWTILHNLYTIWLLNKLNLASSRIASHAWRFITKKTKLKIHWPFITDCVQISDKFKDCLLPSTIAFTADLRFSYLHINRAPKAVNVFTEGISVFHFFYPEVINLKLYPFVTNGLLQILLTSQTFNYCWPLLKLPLAFLLTSHGCLSLTMVSTKGWRHGEYSDCVRLFCFVTNVLNVTNDPHNCRISVLIIYFPKQMLS